MKVIDALYEIAQDNKNINIKTNAFFRKLTENMSYKELIKGLNSEVEIMYETPEEDKKIEKVNIGCIAGETLRNIDWHILDKLDEIIDKVNGDKDDNGRI